MEARRSAFVYVVNILISDTELLVVWLIPLVRAVWMSPQQKKNPCNILFVIWKKSWQFFFSFRGGRHFLVPLFKIAHAQILHLNPENTSRILLFHLNRHIPSIPYPTHTHTCCLCFKTLTSTQKDLSISWLLESDVLEEEKTLKCRGLGPGLGSKQASSGIICFIH